MSEKSRGLKSPDSLPEFSNSLSLSQVDARNVNDVRVRRVTSWARHPYLDCTADSLNEDCTSFVLCLGHRGHLITSFLGSSYVVSQPITKLYPPIQHKASRNNQNFCDIRHTPSTPLLHPRTLVSSTPME
jgi:hypothetical protein